ncbi:MAG: NUDIX hydrolase [Hormoscilla sp.]
MEKIDRPWQTLDRFVEISSPWLKLIGEHLRDDRQREIEYWRVEKADSAIALTLQNDKLLLPLRQYRPGLAKTTLDFPGGRVSPEQTPLAAIPGILERELGVNSEAIARLTPLNPEGWPVNSSFSNQKLYGFVVELQPTASISNELLGATYATTSTGIRELLQNLTCLQCRAVLLEWLTVQSNYS